MLKLFERPLFLLALILVAVLPVMALMPFSDTTEPRYAEIARLMLERNDWITPWFDPQTPFWGKPHLFLVASLKYEVFRRIGICCSFAVLLKFMCLCLYVAAYCLAAT